MDWRADLTIASSLQEGAVEGGEALQPCVQLKLSLDSLPERNPEEKEVGRVNEVAFELSAEKLDVLVKEMSTALSLMEGA